MYSNINDFLTDWQYEAEGTTKILNLITDDQSRNAIHQDVRSLKRLSWHLIQTLTEMGHKAGLFTSDVLEQVPIPDTMAELVKQKSVNWNRN